jgi:hypothetical protein
MPADMQAELDTFYASNGNKQDKEKLLALIELNLLLAFIIMGIGQQPMGNCAFK